jgi:hypothetical protein
MRKLERGDKVAETQGCKFVGTVVAVFENLEGEIRFVVQVDPSAMADRLPRIFSESDLQLATAKAAA